MFGYIGKILFINLSDGTHEVRPLDEKLARDYLGGYGLGARILYDEMPAHTPWDAPESIIGFVRAPLNGTPTFFGARYMVVSKSPVYNGWNDANCGGTFGPALTKSGFDAVFVKGISEKPVYILLDNGKVEIRDASHLWGKTTMETEKLLNKELGENRVAAAMIAPAGENLSYMAAVMNDAHRAAGRGGSGAVMGSKRLKAIVARGSYKIEVADKETLLKYSRQTGTDIHGSKAGVMAKRGMYGTAISTVPNILTADGSVKNWMGSSVDDFPEEKALLYAPEKLDEGRRVKKYACVACPLGCGAIYNVEKDGLPSMPHTGRPEYETITGFGSQMLVEDVDQMIYCNHLCNEYGFDVISMAGTVAWAMECYNDGLLSIDDLDGIDLKWGDGEAMCAVTERICKNEGNCARLLKNGSRFAANAINGGHYALFEASGIELAQHDPRLTVGLGRIYQYDPSPGRHVKGGFGLPLKNSAPEVRYNTRGTGFSDALAVSDTEIMNSAGYCMFYKQLMAGGWMQPIVEAVTGFKYTPAEWYLMGLRIFMMRLAFNVREGMRRKDYTMSDRCITEPKIKNGPLAGIKIDVETVADNLFMAIGCDMDFVPRKEMLKVLGLDDLIADIYQTA